MGPLIDTGFFLAGASGFWFLNLALLIFFARKPRTTRQKILSLAIPTLIIVVGSVVLFWLYGSRLDSFAFLFMPLGTVLIWSVSVITVLIVPHLLSIFIRKQSWLYGIFAALFLLTPTTTIVYNMMDYHHRTRELSHLKLAAEPEIAKCCAGIAASCHEVANVFSKASELGGYQRIDHDLRNKYYAVACRQGSLSDCRDFENGTGMKLDQALDAIYVEPCNQRDLYRLPERPRDPEEN